MVLHTSINIDALELSNHPTKHSRRMENQSVNHRVFKDNQYIHSLQATMTFVTSFKHPPDDLLLPNSGRLDEFVQSYHSVTKLEMSLDSNSIRYKRDDPSQDDCSFHLLGPLPSSRLGPWNLRVAAYPRDRQFCPFTVITRIHQKHSMQFLTVN